jgi:acetyl esterase/lipase
LGYLVAQDSKRVILAGDSGGAAIALQVYHYLLKNQPTMLTSIEGIVMLCPWLDLSQGHRDNKKRFEWDDQIPTSLLEKGARSIQTASELPRLDDIWVSPYAWINSAPDLFQKLPPIYSITGEIGRFRKL